MTAKKTAPKAEPKEAKLSPVDATIKALKREGVTAEIWEADQATLEGKSYIRLATEETTRLVQIDTTDLESADFVKHALTLVNK